MFIKFPKKRKFFNKKFIYKFKWDTAGKILRYKI